MKGDEVIEDGTIVVEDNRITAVGPRGVGDGARRGAKVVDVAGRTIIPGLFDEHAHLHYSTLDIFPQRPWKYLANLAYGVTTTHDPSASTHEVVRAVGDGRGRAHDRARASSRPASSSTAPTAPAAPSSRAWTTRASTCAG